MQFAHYACGPQKCHSFNIRKWLLAHEKCKNTFLVKITNYTVFLKCCSTYLTLKPACESTCLTLKPACESTYLTFKPACESTYLTLKPACESL